MGERIAGVILAGGRATRMGGGDKCLRLLGGKPLLAHVAVRLAPQVDALILNANGTPERFAAFALDVVPDILHGVGPLAGVLTGMRWAEERGFSGIATAAADSPFFPRDLVFRLQAASDGMRRIVLPRSGGHPHPTFALWPVALANDLEGFLDVEGPSSMRAFAGGRHEPLMVDFAIDGDIDPFFNINTQDDLRRAQRLAETLR